MDTTTSNSAQVISWWYEYEGERKGPLLESEIIALIGSGNINKDTMVWSSGMDAWVEIGSTPFASNFSNINPPPLTGDRVDNKIVWWLAFAPILGLVAEGILLEITNPEPTLDASWDQWFNYATRTDFDKFWFCTLGLNIILSLADEKRLKKAGHDTNKMGSAWLVPYYLFKRAEMLKQNNAYFWVWIVTFVISLL